MSENYLVWGRVAEFAGRYSKMDENGDIVPDPETQGMVRRKLTALRRFFADNGLLTVEAFDDQGTLIDQECRKNDFTDEGIELLRRKEGAWLNSKGSRKDPPDMKLLEKALAEIRAGK
ncbi:hypothetical protein AAB992_39235 [Burkholderia contaminans]|uniref:hypothetical protein n=1 Tax=Burkholderia contaminans TaxID=488447 RepID=UPI002416AA48|nr:hypothetical protein [Burkholderia contaminans]WFN12467.1 hypothetical protein LXE92_29795 [Burkholderia contaminans]